MPQKVQVLDRKPGAEPGAEPEAEPEAVALETWTQRVAHSTFIPHKEQGWQMAVTQAVLPWFKSRL